MKKILAFILSLTLLCGAVAMADTYTNDGANDPSTELKVTVSSGYTIVIPATLDIPFNQTATNLTVEVTALHLPSTANALKVAVGTMNPLTNEANKTLAYTMDGKTTSVARYFQKLESQNFVVGITQADWNKAPAGNYSGTVNFIISFDNIANQ